jgi:hypothetical protein
MQRSRIARSGMLAMLLATPTLAQAIWIVDDDGGAGVHFTDIPPAIAAASSGDVLRVFPGSYSTFVLDKALVIVAQPGGTALVNGLAKIAGIGGGTSIAVVAGLTPNAWKVTNCYLPVLLDACTGTSPPYGGWDPFGLEVTNCTDLRVQRSSFKGGSYPTPYGDGGDGVRIANGRVQLSDCIAIGPHGAHASTNSQPYGGHGGSGIENVQSTFSHVHAYRCQLKGGNGGKSYGSTGYPGNGGHGLHSGEVVLAGLAEHQIVSGVAGTSPYGYGWDGYAILATLSLRSSGITTQGPISVAGPVQGPVPPDPSLQLITSFPAAGQNLTLRVEGPPGAHVELVFGREPVVIDQPGLQEDILVAQTRRVIAGPISSTGVLDWTIGLSPALQHGTVFLVQAELLYPAGDLRRTNSVTVVLR